MIHRVVRKDSDLWAPIFNQIVGDNTQTHFIASTWRPGAGTGPAPGNDADGSIDVPASSWCKTLTSLNSYGSVQQLTDTMVEWLTVGDAMGQVPALLIIDEIADPEAGGRAFNLNIGITWAQLVKDAVAGLAHTGLGPRIGAYVAPKEDREPLSWTTLNAIQQVFQVGGFICPEFYHSYNKWCQQGGGANQKAGDKWMQKEINDELSQIAAIGGNSSNLAPVFGVGDNYLWNQKSKGSPNKFIERKFFNTFKSGSKVSKIRSIGSWKWDTSVIEVERNPNVAKEFVASWRHWEKNGNRYVRKGRGIPPCQPTGTKDVRGKPVERVNYGNLKRGHPRDKPLLADPGNLVEKPSNPKAHLPRLYKTLTYNSMVGVSQGAAEGTRHKNEVKKQLAANYGFSDKQSNKILKAKGNQHIIKPFTTRPMINWQARYDLYVEEITMGYGAGGDTHTSKWYQRFYPKSLDVMPINVKGWAYSELDLEALGDFIRDTQIEQAQAERAYFALVIPATGITMFGLIESFTVNVGSTNPGIDNAPRWEFDFIPVADRAETGSGGVGNAKYSRVKARYFDKNAFWKRKFRNFGNDYVTSDTLTQAQELTNIVNEVGKQVKNAGNQLKAADKATAIEGAWDSVRKLWW